jgi:uncharacterized membrane protein (DUF485 family)
MSEIRSKRDVLDSPLFLDLARRKDRICLVLTLLILVVYYGFISLVAFRKDLVAIKLSPHVSLGIPVGIGVIVFSWLLTGIYVQWANRRYDQIVRDVRRQLGEKA